MLQRWIARQIDRGRTLKKTKDRLAVYEVSDRATRYDLICVVLSINSRMNYYRDSYEGGAVSGKQRRMSHV
jgi:hypothetical protein